MLKNFDFILKDLDGTEFTRKDKPLTAQYVAIDALQNPEMDPMGRAVQWPLEEHTKRGALAKRIFDNIELDLDAKEIVFLEECIAKNWISRVVYVMHEFLKC